MYISMGDQICLTRGVEGKTNQRHTPLQPIPLLLSSSFPIHSSPYSSASLTFDWKRLGRLNQRGGGRKKQEVSGGMQDPGSRAR